MPGLSVTYTLKIDGSPAPPEVLAAVQQVQVEDHAEKADMLRLKVLTGVRESGSGWTLADDQIFRRLAKVNVALNVGQSPGIPLIEAYVMDTRIKLSNTPGRSELEVIGMDPTLLMNLDEKVRAWPNMSDSDIASTVFGEYGFDSDIENSNISYQEDHATPMQRGTDMAFLQKLAKRNGFECFVVMDDATGRATGHFHKPRVEETPQGVLSINLGESTNVNGFNARFDMLQPSTASARTVDIEAGEAQDGQADVSSLRSLGAGGTVDLTQPRRVLLGRSAVASAAEMQNLIQAEVDRSSFSILAEGELNTVAYGSVLRAKKLISVRGAGNEFSGTYYVRKVMHTFTGDGYKQKFQLERNASGLEGRENFAPDDALTS